jgi:ABC-type amino acid transport substrate-binding protein
MKKIRFWNGNKSPSRQRFELSLLKLCLDVTTQNYEPAEVVVDQTDYPKAQDESNVLNNGADILVTVAGNVKFSQQPKQTIMYPLLKGLLGFRLLVIPEQSSAKFQSINQPAQLRALRIGIPETWADAELFRHNQYTVVEKGHLANLLLQLKQGRFDYVALGVNEIEDICGQFVEQFEDLVIEPSLLLYYPFPLVFYVNPNNPELASRIEKGLEMIFANGQYDTLFAEYFSNLVTRLGLQKRKLFTLSNPMLPAAMQHFSASLLD